MEDERIIELYNKRSEDAIAATQEKYGSACYAVAFGILENREDSEECVNDTYIHTWGAIPPDMPSHLGAYLRKITRRLAIDRYRKRNADKRITATVVIDELSECIPSDDGDMGGYADKMAVRDALTRFLASLPPENRIIFMRRYWYMSSTRDIARMLTMTEAAVKMKLHRMRRQLKKYLEKEGIER